MKITLLVLAGLSLAVFAACQAGSFLNRRHETVRRAEAPTDPETRFVETRSGRTHVLDIGDRNQTDRVILLLHGTGRSVADWQEGFAAQMASRGHRVLGIDYYGMGLSDRAHGGRYGIALWAEQAVDVLDALSIERATVIGHSAGGGVAAIVTADHPERVERAVFIGHGMAMDPVQWIPILPGVGEIALSRTEIFGDAVSPEHERRLRQAYAIRGTRKALLTYIRRQYTIDGLRLVTGTYEDIQRPVLQMHGSEDASIPVAAGRGLTTRMSDARFVAFEGVGHDVHMEAPERLAAAVEEFVAETAESALD